jgi:hypothetical protein
VGGGRHEFKRGASMVASSTRHRRQGRWTTTQDCSDPVSLCTEMLEDDERRSRPARQEDPMSHIRRHTEGIYSELLRYGMGQFIFIIIIIRMCEYVYYYYYYLQTVILTSSQSLTPAVATRRRWCQTPSLPRHLLALVERRHCRTPSPSNAVERCRRHRIRRREYLRCRSR